jgi:hypothetical protein
MDIVETRSCEPRRRPDRSVCCLGLKQPPDLPDPAIYSQAERFAVGVEPTWDSPDILTNSLHPWRLLPESSVVVRNLSGKVAAVNTLVRLRISPFGIGLPRQNVSVQQVTLLRNEVKKLLFPLPQAVLKGDQLISAFVDIFHPTDARSINNHGEQAIQGLFTSDAGRSPVLHFPVRNDAADAETLHLQLLANDVNAVVSPASHSFGPFEQISVKLSAHVPDTVHGAPGQAVALSVTVVARDSAGRLRGGVTVLIRVDT